LDILSPGLRGLSRLLFFPLPGQEELGAPGIRLALSVFFSRSSSSSLIRVTISLQAVRPLLRFSCFHDYEFLLFPAILYALVSYYSL
jgi:hypothetical protein